MLALHRHRVQVSPPYPQQDQAAAPASRLQFLLPVVADHLIVEAAPDLPQRQHQPGPDPVVAAVVAVADQLSRWHPRCPDLPAEAEEKAKKAIPTPTTIQAADLL